MASGTHSPLDLLASHSPGPMPHYPRAEIAAGQRFPQTPDGSYAQSGADGCQIPTMGNQKLLVLPVIVSDYATPPVERNTAAKLSDFLFGTPSGRRTVTNYFAQASRGATAGALQWSGDVMEWRTINHSNTASSQTSGSELMLGSDPIVREALQAFDADIDYSKYDSNGDGCIDWLLVVHSGPDQAQTYNEKDIRSHFEFYAAAARDSFDGRQVWGSAVVSAWSPIGTYVHELGHALGLPDLYSYGPPNKSIVGLWSVMDMGMWAGPSQHKGEWPTGIDPYGLLLLGWASPQVVTTTTAAIPIANPTTTAPTVIKVPLASLGTPAAEHYLLIESRLNYSGRGATGTSCTSGSGFGSGFIDDCETASGVLVWEVDEGGYNAFGELRQLVTVADAYPGEEVKGIAAEALLSDAPYGPATTAGTSSRYERRGVRIDVNKAVASGYEVSVVVDSSARAELKAKWIRVTPDPHSLGQTMTVDVQVVNVGSAATQNAAVAIAPIASGTWTAPLSQLIGTAGVLAPGETAAVRWPAPLSLAGQIDLYATVSAGNAATVLLHDKAYVGGKISQFDIATQINMGDLIDAHLTEAFDFELAACVRTLDPSYLATAPADIHAACNAAAAPAACTACQLYNYQRSAPFPTVDPAAKRYCWVAGSFSPCRGEITKIWTGDFIGDSRKEILVAYRDDTERIRQSVHCSSNPKPSDCADIAAGFPATGVGWEQLTMFSYNASTRELEKVWEAVPTAVAPVGVQSSVEHGCMYLASKPIELGDGRTSILLSNLCGGYSSIVQPNDTRTGFNQIAYKNGELLFSADVLASGADFDKDNVKDFVLDQQVSYTDVNRTLQLAHFDLTGAKPAIKLGATIAWGSGTSLFLDAYRSSFGPGTVLSTYDAVHDALLMPKAFLADVNQDGAGQPDLVFADGNGINSGRLMVFDWSAAGQPEMKVIRKNWGNITTDLLPIDWDGDGQTEIVLTNSAENSIHVFKHVAATGEYAEIFTDSFGGYTGTAYNPNIAVADVDGNGTPDVIIGQGGHCSVPNVGSGVYVYGFGMVLRDDDRDGDGVRDATAGLGIFTVAAADLDGDGKAEIIAGSQSGDLYVLHHHETDSQPPNVGEVE
jgi:M6 family metalloprotease-like protein